MFIKKRNQIKEYATPLTINEIRRMDDYLCREALKIIMSWTLFRHPVVKREKWCLTKISFREIFLFKSLFHTLRFGIFATKFKGHGTCEPIFHTIKLWSQQECYFWFCVCQHYLIGKLFLGCYCMVISDKNVLQFDILWSHQK